MDGITFGDIGKERGRELTVHDLKPKQVVLIGPTNGSCISIWVSRISWPERVIRFWSGTLGIAVECTFNRHGEVYTEEGTRVHVYEFLGEV